MRTSCLVSMGLMIAPALAAGQEASYLMAGTQLPIAKVSNGHVQVVTPYSDDWVHVRVSASYGAVGVVGRYQGGMTERPFAVPAEFEMPRALSLELRKPQSAWSAATAATFARTSAR